MNGDNRIPGWETSTPDYVDRCFMTDISETITSLSSKSRNERRRQKLREDLVLEYFEHKQRPKTRLQSIVGRLFHS